MEGPVSVRLRALTPLHVGTVEASQPLVKGLDFRLVDSGRRVEVVDVRTLPPDAVDEYVRAVESGRFDVAERLLGRAEVLWESEVRTPRPPSRFHPTCRETVPPYRPYVPGTSFKGALRTGLLVAALRRLRDEGVDVRTLFGGKLPRDPRKLANALDVRMRVTVFQLGSAKRKSYGWPNIHPHSDVLHGLSVTDARPVGDVRTVVYEPENFPRGPRHVSREFVVDGTFEVEVATDPGVVERPFRHGLPGRLPRPVKGFLLDARRVLRDFWEDVLGDPGRLLEVACEGWRECLSALGYNLGRLGARRASGTCRDADLQLGWGGGRFTKTVLGLRDVVPGWVRRRFEPKTFRLVDGFTPGLVVIDT